MQFVHKTIRLSCDLNRAFRFLTRPEMIGKWSGSEAQVELKTSGVYILSNSESGFTTENSKILDYEREKHLHILWKDSEHTSEDFDLLIRIMPCRSDTEFCAELHLLFKHNSRALTDGETTFYSEYFENLLESLRLYQNKDWVIQDSELTMSWLKGSSF